MEVPRLGVELGLQPLAYVTAVATYIAHGNARIFNPLSEARDQTRNLMVPSGIHFCCAMMGSPDLGFYHLSAEGPD